MDGAALPPVPVPVLARRKLVRGERPGRAGDVAPRGPGSDAAAWEVASSEVEAEVVRTRPALADRVAPPREAAAAAAVKVPDPR